MRLTPAPLDQLFEPLARALLCGRAGAGGLLLVPAESHQLFGGELLLAPGLQDVAGSRLFNALHLFIRCLHALLHDGNELRLRTS